MSDVRWEPVEYGWQEEMPVDVPDDDARTVTLYSNTILLHMGDSTGQHMFFALPPDIRLCRAVAPQWSQEQPTDCDRFWLWRPKWKRPLGAYVRPHSYDPMDLVLVMENGLRVPLSEMEHDTWYMPAPVPPPPKGTDNASSR